MGVVAIWILWARPGVLIGVSLTLGAIVTSYLTVKLYSGAIVDALLPSTFTAPSGIFPFSTDGRFRADTVQTVQEDGVHYTVVEVITGRTVLTTHAEFPENNSVKGGHYCDDGRFLAAYHYGHEENYTWIGAWSLENGGIQGKPKRI